MKRNINMSFSMIALILSIASICLFCIFFLAGRTEKHTLYIGTNDKDTYRAERSVDEASAIVDGVLSGYEIDYTLAGARGVWRDDNNQMTSEDTLVLIVYGVSDQTVSAVCADLLSALNQASILVEKDYTRSYLVSG